MAGLITFAIAVSALLSKQGVTTATPMAPAWTQGTVFNVYGFSDAIYALPLFLDTDSGSIVMTSYETAGQLESLLPLAFQVPGITKTVPFEIEAVVDTAAPVQNKATQSPPFERAKLYLPTPHSSSRKIGVLADDAAPLGDDVVMSKFGIFDLMVSLYRGDGEVIFGGYCAFETKTPKVWSISYNVTSPEEASAGFPIDLANVAPSSVDFKVPEGRHTGNCRTVKPLV